MSLPALTPNNEILPFSSIRVETLLSKNPVHRLSNRGHANIEIRDKETGKVVWEVSHNSKYGEPGPLAYKVETLVINRRIDEARSPQVPEIIRLGSMREIAELCDLGADTNKVKRALYQNASAFITAFLSYFEEPVEIGGTRYTLVFTGEHFPDGRKADAVYILLNRWYWEILNSVSTRPLDYDYLKALPPAAQRFYELISFQIYGILKNNRPRARMLYSDFCTLAPQVRYFQYKRMHRQMGDVHAPHIASGYLEKAVEFRETTDRDGNPDWEIFYTPGAKARADHSEPGKRIIRRPRRPRQLSLPLSAPEPTLATMPVLDADTLTLAEQLTAHGLGKGAAAIYAQAKPEECRRQLDYLPYVTEFKNSKGAYLRKAIEDGYGPPKGYEDAKSALEARAKMEIRTTTKKARETHEEAHRSAYDVYLGETLTQMETTAPETYNAFCAWEQKDRLFWKTGPMSKKDYAQERIAIYDDPGERLKRFSAYLVEHGREKQRIPGVLSFWEWDKAHNPQPFQT